MSGYEDGGMLLIKKVIFSYIILSYFLLLVGCSGEESLNIEVPTNVEYGKEDYRKIVSPSNQLGLELLSKVKENNEGNVFISPISLFMALSMIYNGSDGITKEELAKVLHIEGMDVNEVNQANASMMSILHNDSDQVRLNIANSIWLNENYHFNNDFSKTTQRYFHAEIQEINVMDPHSLEIINNWVEKETNKKIKKLIDSIDPNVTSLLINAVYFKGAWTNEFDKKLTKERTFYFMDGSSIEVPLMSLKASFPYFENDNFQAITLSYGESEEMSMKVFLPRKNISLIDFENLLTSENWEKWMSKFKHEKGTIMLPKFQMIDEVILNDPLKELGMSSSFETKSANFSRMIQEEVPIWISEVKQKTFLEVNEKGAEATGATLINMKSGSSEPTKAPFVMEVNRPFFIAITDDKTGAILFLGLVHNPSFP